MVVLTMTADDDLEVGACGCIAWNLAYRCLVDGAVRVYASYEYIGDTSIGFGLG